ncbi:MAG: VOC family protein [Acidimicrobiia bacterium]|nr:VOC family protein [Acidimicrobiia bacterium]
MKHLIDRMLDEYDSGRIRRRDLVAGLAALAGAAPATAASTFRGVEINHIALRVTDVVRSRDFYQKHLGMPVVSESANNCFLGLGKNFLALFKGDRAGMDHYCIAIDGYKVEQVTEELKRQGLNPRRTADRVYFPDPDGLTVQLSAAGHQP